MERGMAKVLPVLIMSLAILGASLYFATRGNERAGLILLVEGEYHNIYVDNKTLERINKEISEKRDYLQLEVRSWNTTECQKIARRFLNNPVAIEASRTRYLFMEKNDSKIELGVAPMFLTVWFENHHHRNTLMSNTSLLTKEEYINRSLQFIRKVRENISDLKFEKIHVPQVTKEGGTGEGEFMGYLGVYVYFRQYLYGLPVKGLYGSIMVVFGPGGVVKSYEDTTIPPELILSVSRCGPVKPLREVLNEFANGSFGISEKDIQMTSYSLCFYNDEEAGVGFPVCYLIGFKPVKGGTGVVIPLEASDI